MEVWGWYGIFWYHWFWSKRVLLHDLVIWNFDWKKPSRFDRGKWVMGPIFCKINRSKRIIDDSCLSHGRQHWLSTLRVMTVMTHLGFFEKLTLVSTYTVYPTNSLCQICYVLCMSASSFLHQKTYFLEALILLMRRKPVEMLRVTVFVGCVLCLKTTDALDLLETINFIGNQSFFWCCQFSDTTKWLM